jgi:polynucleotide 5'-hydroxyl-kinase GRC3/NOL9
VQLKVSEKSETIPEPEWEGIVEELLNHRGTAFIIGASDSGKTTLARYLIKNILSENLYISFVDTDIGQSSLGLPGTITMKLLKKSEDIKNFQPEKIFFIGSLNPAKKMPLMIQGTKKMVDMAKKESEIIIVDTTGLIDSDIGKALKGGKIRSVQPGHIIAIQKHNEVEHLLTSTGDAFIHRIKASRMAKQRTREERFKYRIEKFNTYFKENKTNEILLDNVDFFYNGRPYNPRETDFKEGTLVGLNRNDDTNALGILLELDHNSITLKSPIHSIRGINRIILGNINIYKLRYNKNRDN